MLPFSSTVSGRFATRVRRRLSWEFQLHFRGRRRATQPDKESGSAEMKDPTTWAQRRFELAERYKATRNQRIEFLHVYSGADLDRIAKALRKSSSEIRSYKLSFENCAYWYRDGHGFGMRRPKQRPPSKMLERMSRIRKAADRLLRAFEVRSDADDGMGEGALGQQSSKQWFGRGPLRPRQLPTRSANSARLARLREACRNVPKRPQQISKQPN